MVKDLTLKGKITMKDFPLRMVSGVGGWWYPNIDRNMMSQWQQRMGEALLKL